MNQTIDVSPGDMLLFATVVREGSFSAAARSLGLTKQSVSERLARLERTLGVRLLERTTRRMRPTDAGAAYAERCQAIATQIREANESVRDTQSIPTGTLRVACPTLFGRRFMVPVVARFTAQYPAVRLELTLTNRRVDLIADGFDLAVQVGRLPDSPYIARRIGDSALRFVSSPSFFNAFVQQHGALTVAVLPQARCLGLRREEAWRVDDERLRVRPVTVVNDLETLAQLAVAGAGIARLPDFLCEPALRDGRLVRLFPDATTSTRAVWVLYPRQRFLAASIQRFLDALANAEVPLSQV